MEASSSQSVVWNADLSSREHALVVEEIANATGSTKSKRVSYKESDKLMKHSRASPYSCKVRETISKVD